MGGTPEQRLKAKVKAEEQAITLYKDIIKQAVSEGDETTRLIFEEIISGTVAGQV